MIPVTNDSANGTVSTVVPVSTAPPVEGQGEEEGETLEGDVVDFYYTAYAGLSFVFAVFPLHRRRRFRAALRTVGCGPRKEDPLLELNRAERFLGEAVLDVFTAPLGAFVGIVVACLWRAAGRFDHSVPVLAWAPVLLIAGRAKAVERRLLERDVQALVPFYLSSLAAMDFYSHGLGVATALATEGAVPELDDSFADVFSNATFGLGLGVTPKKIAQGLGAPGIMGGTLLLSMFWQLGLMAFADRSNPQVIASTIGFHTYARSFEDPVALPKRSGSRLSFEVGMLVTKAFGETLPNLAWQVLLMKCRRRAQGHATFVAVVCVSLLVLLFQCGAVAAALFGFACDGRNERVGRLLAGVVVPLGTVVPTVVSLAYAVYRLTRFEA